MQSNQPLPNFFPPPPTVCSSTGSHSFCVEPQPLFPGNGQVPSNLTQLSQGKAVMISLAGAPRLLFPCAVFYPKTPLWSRPACSIAVICRTTCTKTTDSSAWLVPRGLPRVSAIELIPSPGISPKELGRNRGRLKISAWYFCMFSFKATPQLNYSPVGSEKEIKCFLQLKHRSPLLYNHKATNR